MSALVLTHFYSLMQVGSSFTWLYLFWTTPGWSLILFLPSAEHWWHQCCTQTAEIPGRQWRPRGQRFLSLSETRTNTQRHQHVTSAVCNCDPDERPSEVTDHFTGVACYQTASFPSGNGHLSPHWQTMSPPRFSVCLHLRCLFCRWHSGQLIAQSNMMMLMVNLDSWWWPAPPSWFTGRMTFRWCGPPDNNKYHVIFRS